MLAITLNTEKKTPLYQQIYEFIRGEMETGRLKSHEKLPSKRELAAYLNVSQTTVETAYAQLKAEGYLYAKEKSGYYAEALVKALPTPILPAKAVFSPKSVPDYRYDFKTGGMDQESFPFDLWAKLTRETLFEDKKELLDTVDAKGYAPLRLEIAKYLRTYRSMEVDPEQIIIGAGWEYLLGLIVQLLGRSKIYGIEDPAYGKMPKILQKNGCATEFLPIESEGLSLAALENSKVEVVHVTPSHQFPLGVVTSANRRRALLHWAGEEEGRYIIEDDYDSEFRFLGRPIPAMYGLDKGEHVIYIKTLTKSLAPSLRMAYMVLPTGLMRRYEEEMSFYASTVPSIEQHVLYRFMEKGAFERHSNRLRNRYKKRRERFIELLKESPLAPDLRLIRENGGMHLLLQVGNQREEALVAKAETVGIRVYGISEYYTAFPPLYPDAVICGFSSFDETTLEKAVKELLAAWR